MSMRPVCLITGGNAGVGYAAAVQLARAGAEVVVAARSARRGAAAVVAIRRESGSGDVSLVRMDLSSSDSIQQGCAAFRAASRRRLDVLIHNAADFDVACRAPAYNAAGEETVWATNHLGPVRLTRELEPELLRSGQGRVVTVSSKGLVLQPRLRVRLDDPELLGGHWSVARAYYQSKLAQVMYTRWLAARYRGTAVTANCVRVTNVRVDLARYPGVSRLQRALYALKSRFAISPEEMARTYTWLALAPELAGVSGMYCDERRRPVRAGRYAEDPANARAVMEMTARYVPGLLAPLPSGRGTGAP